MKMKQKLRPTKEEFENIAAEIRALVGKRLKTHEDGDAEKLLFE